MGYPYPNFCLCAFLGPYFKEALWECEGFDAGSLVSIAVLCSGILPMSICTSKVTAFGPSFHDRSQGREDPRDLDVGRSRTCKFPQLHL